MRAPRHARRAARGFTLIEVIVALVLMAVMTVMAWRAVSALLRTVLASCSIDEAVSSSELACISVRALRS